VAELLRRPGTQRSVVVAAPLAGVGVGDSHLAPGEDVVVDLVLEAAFDAIVATGTVRAVWEGECRRCLRTVRGTMSTSVREVFEPHPVEGETYALEGDSVDLEPLVRDAVLLALPVAPLCEDSCAGPDPDDYPVAADGAEAPDPRWSALRDLHFDT
jgi:uncharacterized protein